MQEAKRRVCVCVCVLVVLLQEPSVNQKLGVLYNLIEVSLICVAVFKKKK